MDYIPQKMMKVAARNSGGVDGDGRSESGSGSGSGSESVSHVLSDLLTASGPGHILFARYVDGGESFHLSEMIKSVCITISHQLRYFYHCWRGDRCYCVLRRALFL